MARSWSVLIVMATAFTMPATALAQSALDLYKAAGARAMKPVATIAYGPDPLQVADLRLPQGRGPHPVAIVIHGGCWLASIDDRRGTAGFAEALGRRGFATWNIEYRRLGNTGGGWPGTFTDVAAATDKLVEVAPRYNLDLKRVTVVGHSAGAHLALWVASRPRLPSPWSQTSLRPQSVVAIDGPAALAPFIGVDAQACRGQSVVVPLIGGTPAQKPVEYRLASPADHLPLGVHQLVIEGVFADLLRPYVAAARSSGDTVDVLAPPAANHFDIVTPGTPSGEAVADFIAANALTPGRNAPRWGKPGQ
ncbi:alpha/beta fold hydrolase [Sphingomonas sp. PL-96]|uniref:alpha/beta hydrolase n=1 Tax=Sphingomonas sp. PL-96 TaxID=2887201 RepID=UPI001E60CC8B|nr:alpha/beta hydrolase [Sphingomonas sp. PL-96]MCC2976739.1 alpha/beta fold hydrolase [Sphingomonas sp. PL-96]